jgi:iron complex outermembrane recepter protein
MKVQTLRTPLSAASSAALLLIASISAHAQQASDANVTKQERIEVTGSSIKRLASETALPVDVITRQDIDKSGATTAAEIVKSISANTAPLADGASITDGTSGQRGFNGANLRGIGVSSTLILLNGRRMANFATPGDNTGVDLNNIPAGAIDRVEVLKDGASAIYGTDAIGGVINFITRKDYAGFQLSAGMESTREGGAGKKTLSLGFGFGSMAKDGFNVFGVVDYQKLDSLRSTQRQFIQDRPLATNLPALMSSNTYPANIDISTAQRNALIAAGLIPAGTTRNRVNPAAPGCTPNGTVYAPAGPGGPVGCSFDYMQDTELYPDSTKVSFLARGTFKLNADHTAFAEVMQAGADTTYVLSPATLRVRNLPVSVLPTAYRNALTGGSLPTTVSGIRFRLKEAGNRTNEVDSTGTRMVLGLTGALGSWDYDSAYTRAENKVTDNYVNGYTLFTGFDAGVRNGTINPFGPSSAAGQTLLSSLRVNDAARSSKGTTDTIDFKTSGAIGRLAGGDMMLAVGAEARREVQTFTPSALLRSNEIIGDRDSSGLQAGALRNTEDSRTVTSFYTELNAPMSKELEVQLALRHDRYSQVGNTTNPKIGVRWQPSKAVLVRGSAGTGFRAPSLYDLYGPTSFGVASSFLTDPQCVAAGGSIDGCTDQWPVDRLSNPNLQPEKSKQFSFGTVIEVNNEWNFSIDYWNIRKTDVISTVGEQVIINNPQRYNGTLIRRDSGGFITTIRLQKDNQGALNTDGVDVGVNWRGAKTDMGRFSGSYSGTYVNTYERQFGKGTEFLNNAGVFLNDQVIQRWRHRLTLNWDYKAFGVTVSNSYMSGYTDQNTTYDPVANKLLPNNTVKAYSLWDVAGSWNVNKNTTVRAGILNIADTPPPFSNQAYYFIASYDPTYTDVRGRTFYLKGSYKF